MLLEKFSHFVEKFSNLSYSAIGWSDVISAISLLLAICSFIYSTVVASRNKWTNAMQFLTQFDSEEMRKKRKTVYDYYNSSEESCMSKENIPPEVESAVTQMIAFYDGNSKLVLEGLIPKSLIDSSTLLTAAYFYKIVQPYMNSRRDSNKEGANRIYACYYAELMASSTTRRKIEKLLKAEDEYKKTFADAEENIQLFEKWRTKKD